MTTTVRRRRWRPFSRRLFLSLLVGILVVAFAATFLQVHPRSFAAEVDDVGRESLPANDGWAAAGAGTTGGAAADAEHVYVVRSRAELADALGGRGNSTSKIIYIEGGVNGFEGPDGKLLTCADLADPEYSLEEYLATYDPEVWGSDTDPSGPLEDARMRSVDNQRAQAVLNIGANTTIVGRRGAKLRNLMLEAGTIPGQVEGAHGVSNIIIRNVTFEDTSDCFPRWRPTDGPDGNWNSELDMVSVRSSTNVWVDHNTFTDGDNPDSAQPVYFGRPYQVHDGALDITHTSDLVTVSCNVFTNHDKVMLIGSTNNPDRGDPGQLNVTVHHNLFAGVVQRAPRMRFGKIDVYNNYYKIPVADPYEYSWGVGVESAGHMENNFFELGRSVAPASVIGDWGGTAITEQGTWARVGDGDPQPTSLLAAYNDANDPDLGDDTGWTPELRHGSVLPASDVPTEVSSSAGAGRLPTS